MSKLPERIPDSALERGKFIETCADPGSLAHHPENREMVAAMYRRFRFERVMSLKQHPVTKKWVPDKPTGEWVIIGKRGQAFEQGVGKLGVTIVTARRVARLVREIEATEASGR